jgi:hypothetical protein
MMIRYARILFFALTFTATQILLASTVVVPALAQNEKTPQKGVSSATPPAAPAKKKLEKPDDSVAKGRERACGNDQNKCGPLWQEMANPHDARYQSRVKAEKAYRDCMVKCMNTPGQRM